MRARLGEGGAAAAVEGCFSSDEVRARFFPLAGFDEDAEALEVL